MRFAWYMHSAPSILEFRGERIPRLVAGTAQRGMAYGIGNEAGAPCQCRVESVVEAALNGGIRFFDTAQAYGESERFLGSAFRSLNAIGSVRVVSKLNPSLSPVDSKAVLQSVKESVEMLGGPLWALLLHRPAWLDVWDMGLGEALQEARRQGLVRYLGASIFTVEEARRALEHERLDAVQIPASAWDQRMLRAGVFRLAAARGKVCFVRSIFLQGLLALPPQVVAGRLEFASRAAEQWERVARKYSSPPIALAVRYALALPAPVVVGMETVEQIRANAALF